MCVKFFIFLLLLLVILLPLTTSKPYKIYLRKEHRPNFMQLANFSCAIAKDELEKHPEMQTIAMVELENDFPSDFSAKVLKCLPKDVAKIMINPHNQMHKNSSVFLAKQSMIIYVADKVEVDESFFSKYFYEKRNSVNINHLSKHLIISSGKSRSKIMQKLLNVVEIFEENQKVIARSIDRTRNLTTFKGLNLSKILFSDRTKNLNGSPINAFYAADDISAYDFAGSDKPNCKWTPFVILVGEKLNATVNFIKTPSNLTSRQAYFRNRDEWTEKLDREEKLDFCLNYRTTSFDLVSYSYEEWCFLAPLPQKFSVAELILFMPLDKSCWMWLGITIAVSTLIWRISEGHWNFLFGAFAYFVGQSAEIRTSHQSLKILLQILILSIFIFCNGYQSLVTSFMLKAVEHKLLTSYDEVLDSDLKIKDGSIDKAKQDDPKYQKALSDGRIVTDFNEMNQQWWEEMVERNLAVQQSCKLMKNLIENWGDGKIFNGIYLISEPLDSRPGDLYTKPFHPLLDVFQELMDRSFEAGLLNVWERWYYEIFSTHEDFVQNRTIFEEKTDLNFDDIAPFFLILAVGFVAALLVLCWEIFFHDFLTEILKGFSFRNCRNPFKKRIKVRRKKRVRIQVKPVK